MGYAFEVGLLVDGDDEGREETGDLLATEGFVEDGALEDGRLDDGLADDGRWEDGTDDGL